MSASRVSITVIQIQCVIVPDLKPSSVTVLKGMKETAFPVKVNLCLYVVYSLYIDIQITTSVKTLHSVMRMLYALIPRGVTAVHVWKDSIPQWSVGILALSVKVRLCEIQCTYLLQNYCNADIDECDNQTHTCDTRNGYCNNTLGSYECLCNFGYKGNNTMNNMCGKFTSRS